MKRLLFPLLLVCVVAANAQQFGGNPPSMKWKQVNTPVARVIFPSGLDSSALRVANIINAIDPLVKPTIGYRQRQVNIVLQNQTTVSNAYVGLAPFRSEFYLTPPQNSFELGSLYWPGQLAIHEYRHVQQYNNFNVGLSHALRIVFGEGGQALGNELSIPNWFFEGDAVYNETLVSRQGRGRLPYFFNGYRSLWAAGKDYSWMKLRNGSYVDFVPDHYPLGYMMVSYGREKYGNTFWKGVTHDAAAYNTGFYPLQNAVRKYAGLDYKQFRTNALNHFKTQFKDDKPYKAEGKDQHFIANEEYPAFISDSALVYVKTTYDKIPRFVIKTINSERTVAIQSITNDNYFSYRNGQIVYVAYRPDARWGYRNYNELVVLDITTGKERRITHKTKYFSPAFSTDGKTIVAVQADPSGRSELHLLDAASGRLISALPNPNNLFYTYPKFYNEGQIVTAVRNTEGQMSLALIDVKTGNAKFLIPFSFEPVGFPVVAPKGVVFYTKTSGLNDELYAVSTANGEIAKLNLPQNKLIGAYQPAISNNKIAWVGLTAYGFKIQQEYLGELGSAGKSDPLSNFGITALVKDSAADLLASVPNTTLPITGYNKAHGLFNFHSLIPNINDPNYSLALAGENVLNTFQSRLSVNYNRDEGYKRLGYEAVYGALFPYMSAGANYTFDRRGFVNGRNIYFNETDLHGGLEVPLNFTSGKTYKSLSFGSDLYYSQRRFQEAFRSQFADRHYTYLNNYASFSNQIQQAKKQINPRFAQTFNLNYKNAIGGINATQLLATTALYFPGLSINHSLVISGAYQQQGKNNGIGFSNDFPFSKGYSAENLYRMSKFGVSYHFPIAYPDAGAANLVYVLRLRGYLFYDHMHASDDNFLLNGRPFQADFRSAGGAVFFDTKFFNSGSVSFGIRYSYLLDPDLFGGNGRNRIELVLPVSIF